MHKNYYACRKGTGYTSIYFDGTFIYFEIVVTDKAPSNCQRHFSAAVTKNHLQCSAVFSKVLLLTTRLKHPFNRYHMKYKENSPDLDDPQKIAKKALDYQSDNVTT